MKWDPVGEAKKVFPLLLALDIKEPPCSSCMHWRPQAKVTPDGRCAGALLCHAQEQYRDFSCYAPPREPKETGR